jgi:hypothetical protein
MLKGYGEGQPIEIDDEELVGDDLVRLVLCGFGSFHDPGRTLHVISRSRNSPGFQTS